MNTSDRRSDICDITEEYHASVAAAAWVQQLNLHVNALGSHQIRQHSSSESSLHVPTDFFFSWKPTIRKPTILVGFPGGGERGRQRVSALQRGRQKHNRERSICKDCGGASICEHNRITASGVPARTVGAPASASMTGAGAGGVTGASAKGGCEVQRQVNQRRKRSIMAP